MEPIVWVLWTCTFSYKDRNHACHLLITTSEHKSQPCTVRAWGRPAERVDPPALKMGNGWKRWTVSKLREKKSVKTYSINPHINNRTLAVYMGLSGAQRGKGAKAFLFVWSLNSTNQHGIKRSFPWGWKTFFRGNILMYNMQVNALKDSHESQGKYWVWKNYFWLEKVFKARQAFHRARDERAQANIHPQTLAVGSWEAQEDDSCFDLLHLC